MNLITTLPEHLLKYCKCLNPTKEEKLFIGGLERYSNRIDLVTFLKQWDAVKGNMRKITRNAKKLNKLKSFESALQKKLSEVEQNTAIRNINEFRKKIKLGGDCESR